MLHNFLRVNEHSGLKHNGGCYLCVDFHDDEGNENGEEVRGYILVYGLPFCLLLFYAHHNSIEVLFLISSWHHLAPSLILLILSCRTVSWLDADEVGRVAIFWPSLSFARYSPIFKIYVYALCANIILHSN